MQAKNFWPSWKQLALLFILCGVGMIVGSFVSAGIAIFFFHIPLEELSNALKSPANGPVLKLIQVVSSFFAMGLPAFLFGLILNKRDAFGEIGFNKAISGKQFFIVVLMGIAGLFIGGVLSDLNSLVPISKNAETFFKELESEYNQQIFALASMKNTLDFIIALFVLALAPAIFEEMLFRGSLQPVFISLSKNIFMGILCTSILFSVIHLSWYGFLTRLFLGILLGYVFYMSKNIWLSIAIHFFNNAVGVTQLYALSKAGMLNDAAMQDHIPVYYGLLSAVILILLFINFKRESELVISTYNIRKNKYLK